MVRAMSFRQYEQPRTKPARRGAPKISRAGAKIVEHVARKTKFVDPELTGAWPSIAGGDIANLCRPGRITGPPSNRTLEIFVSSGAAASEVQMKSDQLLEKLKTYFGPAGITRIAIRQMAQSPVQSANTSNVGDERLGAALSAFRNAVNRRGDPAKKPQK
ncbi:MAG: DUF721 domain-containing protein [Marinicaulis sp.]|nr:DUF721 domain-containing protein [Marinicaulis sp.]